MFARRQFLKSVLGGAVALPLLNFADQKSAFSAPPTFPKRLVLIFSPNGTIPTSFFPQSGGETDFVLPTILAPLEPHRKDILILENVDDEAAFHGPGDGHQTGMGCLWTGIELADGTEFKGGCDSCPSSGWAGGISVDQKVANKIGADTKLSSLELGVQVGGASVWSRMSYKDRNVPLPPENDPGKVFERVFASLGADPTGLARQRDRRKSVLDAITKDFTRMQPSLASADRVKVQVYADALRDIEKRLDATGLLGASCVKPDAPSKIDLNDSKNYPAIGKMQMDLLTMSLACDLTRVGSIQWSNSVGQKVHSWQGIGEAHHDLSHLGDSDTDAQSKLVKINTWYAEQFAYLIDAMKKIPEGSGTMLDNTLIVWGNELGVGNSHTRRDIPWVLAGGAGGYFKTGRHLKYPKGTRHNDLLVSICNAMGLSDVTTFGNPAYSSGKPLSGLTG
ncbi:MAG: DUF1552 domain-containing protein [Polyangiales bacterium]